MVGRGILDALQKGFAFGLRRLEDKPPYHGAALPVGRVVLNAPTKNARRAGSDAPRKHFAVLPP